MGRAILIILIGSILLLSTIAFNTKSRTNQARESAVSYYSANQSRNICNSKVGMLMSTFADDKNYRVKTAQTKSLFNGTTTYTMKAVLLPSMTDSVMEVNVTGIHFGDTSKADIRGIGFSDSMKTIVARKAHMASRSITNTGTRDADPGTTRRPD